MTHQSVKNLDECRTIAQAVLPPRYLLLDRFERFVDGTQYEGRPNWFTAVDTPLAEREPCIVYPAAEIAIESYVDLLVGAHRFPEVEVKKPGEEKSKKSKKGAEGTTPKGLAKFIKRNGFKALIGEIISNGLGCGTACIILGLRDGKPFVETVPAKWCTPEFKPGTNEVTRLVIEYPYIKTEQDAEGKWVAKVYAFHRDITPEVDATALPVEIVAKTAFRWSTTKWTPDKDRTVAHGLGFVPVVWWAREKGATVEARIDGHPLHEHLLDEITMHDLALSQRQSAAFLAGSPQWTEVGVDPGFNPTSPGRPQAVPATPRGGPLGPDNPKVGAYSAPSSQEATRKKGPGNVWQYPAGVIPTLHQLSPGALEAIAQTARDLRTKICEGMSVVLMDPENLPNLGTMSGEAQKMLKERQLARCDKIRIDVADNLLRPTIAMLSRIVDSKVIDVEDVDIEWPAYIKPSKTEKAATIQQTVTAISAAIIAVPSPTFKKLARMAIVDEIEDDLDEEEREEIERELDEAEAAEPEEMHQGPEGEEEPGEKPAPAAPPPGQHPPPKTRVTKETWGGPA